MRRKTRQIHVGNLAIGGNAPIAVQSMTTTYTRDVESTVAQIHRLEDVGCEIVRVAVPEMEDALVIGEIKKRIHIPLVADIHYNPQLALEVIRQALIKYASTLAICSMGASRWNKSFLPPKSVASPCVSASTPVPLMRLTSVRKCSAFRYACVMMVCWSAATRQRPVARSARRWPSAWSTKRWNISAGARNWTITRSSSR